MNRIDQLFKEKKDILNIYFTAGYPQLEDTTRIIQELSDAGVDMIEIGIPFSDPLADGPTIQNSSEIALKNGMTLSLLFQQLENIRQITQIPLLLMGYLNPIIQFGVEHFLKRCREIGVDGLILPDLPLKVYREQYQTQFGEYNLRNVQLITPQTSIERIKDIDSVENGFIYIVSSASTTGGQVDTSQQEQYFRTIEAMKLSNPTLIGFGINNSETYQSACNYSNGAIIGSAFIKHLDTEQTIQEFISGIRV
ncbi:MAG: tryptophan synthase subunit alpha [Flavobacteriales bacterium]|nr:tryptophan synthase subunit alpha [Flavobacteriales bacterium]